MPCITGGLGSEDPPPDQRAEETVLTEAEVKELTERFLFGDPAGVKATGPNGAASRATLGLIVTCLAVRKSFWPSHKPEIKVLLADELGRFDQEELLAHIINNALGRPLLAKTDARDVGTAANNAIKKEKKETAEAKARTGAAVSEARAAARLDPSFFPQLAAAEAARAAELAAVLAQEYNLKLPNSTVGAKRKQVAAPDPFEALQRAEAAVWAAQREAERLLHEYEALGPQPELQLPTDVDDAAGEAAACRRWDRENEMRERAAKAWAAALGRVGPLMRQLLDARILAHDEEERLERDASRQRERELDLQRELRWAEAPFQVRPTCCATPLRPHVPPLSSAFTHPSRCSGFRL